MQPSPAGEPVGEECLSAILENMAEAFIALDSSYYVVYVNSKTEELLSINRDQLLSKSFWDVFPLATTTQFSHNINQVISKRIPLEFEEFYPALKRWLQVRLMPHATGLLVYCLDITARRQLETTLRQEQDFLKVLLDNVQAGIVACDAAGQLKLFNQAARVYHGLPEQPLLPEQWAQHYDLYLPDGKTPMQITDIPLFRALQGQQVDNVEMMIIPQQGMPRILSAHGQMIVNSQGKKQGAVVVMHDITDRKQIENALRESEAQLSSIFQTIPDGIVLLDAGGKLIAANQAAERILKLTHSGLTERVYNDLCWSITTVDGQPFPEDELPFVRVMQTGKSVYGIEHAIAHADGTTAILSINASPLFNAAGEIVSVISAISDITARKQAETALRESEERYRSVIAAAAEGIVLQHVNGEIFTCNDSAEEILGLTADQMMGRTSLDPRWRAIHEDGSPFPGETHPSMVTLRTGEPQTNVTMGVHKPDGSLTWISINTRPLFQPNQTQPFAVVASFFDITERKQAEEKRVQLAQEQVARAAAEAAQQRSAFLAEVSAVLASSLDYEQTLQSVANLAVPYFADWCCVDLLEDRTITRVAVAHADPEKVKLGWEVNQRYPRHLDDGYGISQVMKTGQSEIAIEITDEQLVATIENPEYLELLRGLNLKSAIIAPLKARGRIFGSISFVFTESDRHYNHSDLSLAEDLARRSAIAIDNARLYQQAQQARQAAEKAVDRTARLQTVTAALSLSLTPLQVAEVIVEQIMTALGATSAMVVLASEDRQELEIIKAVGYHDDLVESWQRFSINTDAALAEAVRTKEPIWLETLAQRIARYPHLAHVYQRYDFNSWMSIPLVVEEKAVGAMSVNFREYRELSEDDREFILAISRQGAQAISRAQLYVAEQTARQEAEQANRVKDEFLAVLSHELRSPLNPILGWTKLLQTQKLPPAKVERALETIERNAKLQAQLIEDLLDISRMLRGKLSLNYAPVDLIAVIEEAMETVQLAAIAKSIHIETALSPITQTVQGDANRLQQVIWNLLSNAIKFTPQGGRVEIQLEEIGHQVKIMVTDSGKGITADFLPYVFDYFRQADSSTTRTFGGLGLGLAIVRQIVELHGGTVQAYSPGENLGATFTVMLPATNIPTELSVNTQPPVPSFDLTGLRVLVVDDEADMSELAAFILSEHGAQVTVAASAAEALTILTQFLPDVLLCDIGMPEMDGYMLMRKIRGLSPAAGGTIYAIALTAYASEYDRRQALAAGFQMHLSKPIDPETLVEAIVFCRKNSDNS